MNYKQQEKDENEEGREKRDGDMSEEKGERKRSNAGKLRRNLKAIKGGNIERMKCRLR